MSSSNILLANLNTQAQLEWAEASLDGCVIPTNRENLGLAARQPQQSPLANAILAVMLVLERSGGFIGVVSKEKPLPPR